MLSVASGSKLQKLRAGDWVSYHGIEWRVDDFSTYQDPMGYELSEWLLKSPQGHLQYYLLREVDPANENSRVNWYLSEELVSPKIYQGDLTENIRERLWDDMHDLDQPYEVLRVFEKKYFFESKTEGRYQGDVQDSSRLTWDYWDESHRSNLALEAWPDRRLMVYISKVVKPEEFSGVSPSPLSTFKRRLRVKLGQALVGLFFLIMGLSIFLFS